MWFRMSRTPFKLGIPILARYKSVQTNEYSENNTFYSAFNQVQELRFWIFLPLTPPYSLAISRIDRLEMRYLFISPPYTVHVHMSTIQFMKQMYNMTG